MASKTLKQIGAKLKGPAGLHERLQNEPCPNCGWEPDGVEVVYDMRARKACCFNCREVWKVGKSAREERREREG